MKKTLITASILAFILSPMPQAEANHGDYSTAGAILVGAVRVALLADAISDDGCRPVRSHRNYRHHGSRGSRSPVYYAPTTTYAPVAYCPPVRTWVPGYYETCSEQVWVPGGTQRVWVEPQYGYQWHCGRQISVLLREGHYECQTLPGHYERQNSRRWVPGHWSNR